MNKKLLLSNFIVVFAMAFALLFQSIHSVEHLHQIVTEKACVHSETNSKTNFTHEHHGLDKCSLCDFTFSQFTSFKKEVFDFCTYNHTSQKNVSLYETIKPNFEGSLFSHRGPPFFIV
jgi:exopolysaccharide biosynthesis protein